MAQIIQKKIKIISVLPPLNGNKTNTDLITSNFIVAFLLLLLFLLVVLTALYFLSCRCSCSLDMVHIHLIQFLCVADFLQCLEVVHVQLIQLLCVADLPRCLPHSVDTVPVCCRSS